MSEKSTDAFTVSFFRGDGGQLLGIARRDRTNRFKIESFINSKVFLTAGYTATSSTINYYDERYPTLHLTFIWQY